MESSSKYFINTHIKEFKIPDNADTIFLYHHQHRKPLTPVPSNRIERLNHFLFLQPMFSVQEPQPAPRIQKAIVLQKIPDDVIIATVNAHEISASQKRAQVTASSGTKK